MCYTMRRKDRALSQEETKKLLQECEYGFLACVGPDGQPYAVPLSYSYDGSCIYFHCALQGRKIEHIAANPNVSFSVVGKTQPVFDDGFTTHYESAIAFGKASIVMEQQEKERALMSLCEKYLPSYLDKAPSDIEKYFTRTAVYKIEIEHISGKANKPKLS